MDNFNSFTHDFLDVLQEMTVRLMNPKSPYIRSDVLTRFELYELARNLATEFQTEYIHTVDITDAHGNDWDFHIGKFMDENLERYDSRN